ncbi:MAG: folate family ECF transporter S component [Clostridia bacterium]|nr:folate family ECF transporter S component [Clostridia bacterium]
MSKMNVRQLTLDAMLAAMCAVLGFIAIDMQSLKITFEGFPVLVGALIFGPLDGFMVGFVGTFVYQLLRYGFTATTLIWVLPYALSGLIVGFVAKRFNFDMNKKEILITVMINELVVLLINTVGIYIDSKIYGYYHPAIITGMLLPRIGIAVAKGLAYSAIIPPLLTPLCKLVRRNRRKRPVPAAEPKETK